MELFFARACLLAAMPAMLVIVASGCGESRGNLLTISSDAAMLAPAAHASWQIQLEGVLDTSFDVAVYDIDFQNETSETIDGLHAAGRYVACYLSAGAYEPWRDDAASFPSTAIGNPLDGNPGESWLDIRDTTVQSLMLARVSAAAAAGCDAVDLANLSDRGEDSGFPTLTSSDRESYARTLAQAVVNQSMSPGLDGADLLVSDLWPYFDWGLAVDCFATDGCRAWTPMLTAGKTVFLMEFGDSATAQALCSAMTQAGFDALIKNSNLDAYRVACP